MLFFEPGILLSPLSLDISLRIPVVSELLPREYRILLLCGDIPALLLVSHIVIHTDITDHIIQLVY